VWIGEIFAKNFYLMDGLYTGVDLIAWKA